MIVKEVAKILTRAAKQGCGNYQVIIRTMDLEGGEDYEIGAIESDCFGNGSDTGFVIETQCFCIPRR